MQKSPFFLSLESFPLERERVKIKRINRSRLFGARDPGSTNVYDLELSIVSSHREHRVHARHVTQSQLRWSIPNESKVNIATASRRNRRIGDSYSFENYSIVCSSRLFAWFLQTVQLCATLAIEKAKQNRAKMIHFETLTENDISERCCIVNMD